MSKRKIDSCEFIVFESLGQFKRYYCKWFDMCIEDFRPRTNAKHCAKCKNWKERKSK